jgi:acetyl-CoA C-acetyltransferase
MSFHRRKDERMTRVCIVAAKRTPQGRFLGALSPRSALDLGVAAGRAALEGIGADRIDQTIVGNVLGAGLGMNVARQVSLALGVPVERPAFTVNMMCASGLQAVILATQAIAMGQAEVVLCGGTESMSNAPYLLPRARSGYRLGDGTLVDCLLRDGLVDTSSGQHMAATAERLAEHYRIDRAAQDAFALRSQQNTHRAYVEGRYQDELVPVDKLERDEHPRPETTLAQLASLRPSFQNAGTVTAGNASGINDGAAMLVVCAEAAATRNGWSVLATIGPHAAVGCDPQWMGLGPVHATRRLCQQSELRLSEFDTIELNEAFAAQALACLQELSLDPERVNPDGGAIALGHPIGATGARLVVHLAHRLARGRTKRALATLCVGGGMGLALVLE